MTHYDAIGSRYARQRSPEPRIAAQILGALGGVRSVLNVGAGTGSYEPTGLDVTALEPSSVMIAQRQKNASAPVVQGVAEYLPFRDGAFDACLAVLAMHHWQDVLRGLAEMQRVARDRLVLLTFDPTFSGFWLDDYFPERLRLDQRRFVLTELVDALDGCTVQPVLIPHDCQDGFYGAYWRRPEAYLDPDVRHAISVFHDLPNRDEGLAALEDDLRTGVWEARYGHLLGLSDLDVGYRLVTAASRR